MKNMIRVGAISAAAALVLTACADSPDDGESAAGADYKACMVSDQGGFDDASFNESAYDGLTRAVDELGIEMAEAESTVESDFAPNLEAQVAAGCDMIITVGFLLADATAESAAANPDIHYAIVDHEYEEPIDNVKPLYFETDEAGFLAGYAAASVTESGTIGTFGGVNIPSVSIFMDGYLAGANYYNEQKGADVTVLGWDGSDGSFVGDFEDQQAGQNITQGFLDQGADVVMPVAGPVGLGAASAIEGTDGAWMIGVDSDWSESASQHAEIMLTSVMKQISNAVFDTIETSLDEFSNERYIGTLENEGVGLADFPDDVVSDETVSELEEIREAIIAGEIEPSSAG